jgi:anti-sigma regulatory factor (Ser/Thr protein kinase)
MGTLLSKFFSSNANTKNRKKALYEIRIASYDSMTTLPRIQLIQSDDISELISATSNTTYAMIKEKGGMIPFIVINEIIENLIHANFKDATVTIFPDGNTINVSDQGPGISDKEKATLPGYTTSTKETRAYIRGVGSGLPITKESMQNLGGNLIIDDNLNKGAVISITLKNKGLDKPPKNLKLEKDNSSPASNISQTHDHCNHNNAGPLEMNLTNNTDNDDALPPVSIIPERHKKILLLLADSESAGPSSVASDLNISLSTAYRDLVALEEYGLVECIEGGKRKLTTKGISFLSYIFR